MIPPGPRTSAIFAVHGAFARVRAVHSCSPHAQLERVTPRGSATGMRAMRLTRLINRSTHYEYRYLCAPVYNFTAVK